MNDTVISVRGLGKQYRIGAKEKKVDTLLAQLKEIAIAPVRNYRQIRDLTTTNDQETLFWALKDISFDVTKGEVIGIIGKNGAGKSTLLKILSRISDPTLGEVMIRGRVSALLEVGTGFHPELTGRENIFMNGTILGMTRKEIKSKFDEILEFSGVEKYIDTPVKFYSTGMKVRLGFAVAAHLEPEILIIDEVLSVGDAEFQKKCLGKMNAVSKDQGRTVLFVSHDLSAVNLICHRGLLIEDGKVVDEGAIGKVVSGYLARVNSASEEYVRMLGDHIHISDVALNKKVFTTFDSIEFSFRLSANEPFSVFGLALLILNKENQRVAVVDLRSSLAPGMLQSAYSINCTIVNIPFLPNDYSIGLFIYSSIYKGHAMNVYSFSIVENQEDIVQYQASYRGIVKLIHKASIN